MISVVRIFRLGIRLAAWATPRVKEWHRQRHFNRFEGQRQLEYRNWSEAEKYLALALVERRHSAKRRFELLLGLEKAQRRQSKLAEAEQSARTAIAVAVEARNQSLHSQALDALVDVQLDQGKHSDAEQTIAEITGIESAQPRPNVALLAQCSRKLGSTFLKNGRNEEAMQAYQEAAQLSEQAFGPAHVETANSFAGLGMLHRQHGNHAEAQRCLRRALEIHRTVSGAESLEATQDLHHLAASLEESGDLDGAATEYERVLALKQRQVGANFEETAEEQVHLAALYLRAGRTAPARELVLHAIGALEQKGGPRLARALETLANVEERMGRTEDARRWREVVANIAATQA